MADDKDNLESIWSTGTSIGASAAAAGAGGFFKILGTAANLLFQWAGLGAAERQEQRQQDITLARERTAETLGRQQIAQTAKASRERLLHEKRQAQKTWRWKEEDRNYGRGQNMVDRFMGLLAADPVAKDRLMMTWNSARIK